MSCKLYCLTGQCVSSCHCSIYLPDSCTLRRIRMGGGFEPNVVMEKKTPVFMITEKQFDDFFERQIKERYKELRFYGNQEKMRIIPDSCGRFKHDLQYKGLGIKLRLIRLIRFDIDHPHSSDLAGRLRMYEEDIVPSLKAKIEEQKFVMGECCSGELVMNKEVNEHLKREIEWHIASRMNQCNKIVELEAKIQELNLAISQNPLGMCCKDRIQEIEELKENRRQYIERISKQANLIDDMNNDLRVENQKLNIDNQNLTVTVKFHEDHIHDLRQRMFALTDDKEELKEQLKLADNSITWEQFLSKCTIERYRELWNLRIVGRNSPTALSNSWWKGYNSTRPAIEKQAKALRKAKITKRKLPALHVLEDSLQQYHKCQEATSNNSTLPSSNSNEVKSDTKSLPLSNEETQFGTVQRFP